MRKVTEIYETELRETVPTGNVLSQHSAKSSIDIILMLWVNKANEGAKAAKVRSRKRFGQEISNHRFSRHVDRSDFSFVIKVLEKFVYDVDVFATLT